MAWSREWRQALATGTHQQNPQATDWQGLPVPIPRPATGSRSIGQFPAACTARGQTLFPACAGATLTRVNQCRSTSCKGPRVAADGDIMIGGAWFP